MESLLIQNRKLKIYFITVILRIIILLEAYYTSSAVNAIVVESQTGSQLDFGNRFIFNCLRRLILYYANFAKVYNVAI